ncbi:MAG: DNA-methyltransferase [Candidatus Thorarchaeota archaeon]
MSELDSNSVELIITSPPYPMIEMWDSLFFNLNEEIKITLEKENGKKSFELMHKELEKVWKEAARVLKLGGIICVNIGDATRKIGKNFQLYPNHVKVTNFFQNYDFIELPCILWRKPTNSPNKFLGSGMLPPNAYVTLEHEYILIFRKGAARRVIQPKLENRYHSAFFWEERNKWFSDIWDDIKGISQNLINVNSNQNEMRGRSAAFPLELPYRLINMFSMYEDTILDPFWGTGTTSLAAMVCARNSIGYEINADFINLFKKNIMKLDNLNVNLNKQRINQHIEYIKNVKDLKYLSVYYKFPVYTKQEIDILLYSIKDWSESKNTFKIVYEKFEFDKF